MAKKKKRVNPYERFLEDPELRQFIYGMTGARDRNEGGIPSGNSLFDPGFFGGPKGSIGLDIDTANYEGWRRKVAGDEIGFFGKERSPGSVLMQDIVSNARTRSTSPYFGIPNK